MDIDWIVTLWSALVLLVATTVHHRNEKMQAPWKVAGYVTNA